MAKIKHSNNLNCFVIGAGGIGLFLQSILQELCSSALIARQHSFDVLSNSPLKITGKYTDSKSLTCYTWENMPELATNACIFVATKAKDMNSALSLLKPKLSAQATVILCQNGIGIYEEAKQILPEHHLFRLASFIGVQRLELNHIHLAGGDKFALAGLEQDKQFLDYWQEIFAKAALKMTISYDPIYSEWQKAFLNIAINGLCSALCKPNKIILNDPKARETAEQLMEETIKIAALEGIKLTKQDEEAAFAALTATQNNINSTLQDLQAGRSTEINYFNGAVIKTAAKHGLTAPLNEMILDLVTRLENSKLMALFGKVDFDSNYDYKKSRRAR